MARRNDYDELDEMLVPSGANYPSNKSNNNENEDVPSDRPMSAGKSKSQPSKTPRNTKKAAAAGLVIGGLTLAWSTVWIIVACVAVFVVMLGGLIWVGMEMGERAGIGDNTPVYQKAEPAVGKTFFQSNIQPELSAEGVKGRLKEVYYTDNGGLGVTLSLSNGTADEHKLVSVGIRIFNDKNETIANAKVTKFKPECKVPAGGYGEVYFTIDKDDVAISDDSLSTLGTTLEIGSQSTSQKDKSDGKGPKDIAPNRSFFENMGNIPELSAEGVKASVVRARYTNDGSLSVTLYFSNGTDIRQKVSKVDLLIQNGNGDTVASYIFDGLDPECIVEKQARKEYEVIIDSAYVSIKDDPLSTLSNTVSVSAAGVE